MLVGNAERTGAVFAASHDEQFAPRRGHHKQLWDAAVALMPVARRDACILAWARLDPFEWHPLLRTCADATLDEVIGLMFAKRSVKSVFVTYPMGVSFHRLAEMFELVGPRAIPMIRAHFLRDADASARTLLEAMGLAAADAAAILAAAGAQAATPAPEVAAEVVQDLTALMGELAGQKADGKIKLTTGALFVAAGGSGTPRGLRRKLAAGTCEVRVHYSEDTPEATATAGVDALCFQTASPANVAISRA